MHRRGDFMRTQKFWALVCLWVAGLACAASAQNHAWKEYSYAGDGFAVTAPAEPALTRQDQATAVGKVEVHDYSIDLGNDTGVMITVAEIPGADKTPPKNLLQGAKNGALKAVKATLSSEKEITFAGGPGLEIEAATDAYRMRFRIFVVKSRLLTLMAIAPLSASIPADSTRIFDSLKLL